MMLNKKKLFSAAASIVLLLSAVPFDAFCAETHTVTIVDFNGKVLETLEVPHGKPVDFSNVDISKLYYHIDDYTQIGFNGWSTYPSSVTEDMEIYALFLRMKIECIAIPHKTEYFSDKGAISTDGLKVTITKHKQLPQLDENGDFITKEEIIDISETCVAFPMTTEEAFKNSESTFISILPPGSDRAIVKYKIKKFEGLGDVNEDSIVNSSDASNILEIYADISTGGNPQLDENKLLACDVNRDSIINSSDASLILDYYAKVSTSSEEISWDEFFS